MLFATAAVFSATAGLWVQDRDVPVKSQLVHVVGHVHPGGMLRIKWNVYRQRSCATTKTQLVIDVDGVRWLLPQEQFPAPPGPMGFDTFVTQTPMPSGISTGHARLRIYLVYVCNPVHNLFPVVDVVPDVEFEIVPKIP